MFDSDNAVPFVPPFLKLDFSDIPELIGAFVLGLVAGVLICLVKNLLHCAVSMSFGIGELSNFILGAVITMLIYRPLSKMFTKMNNSFAKKKNKRRKIEIKRYGRALPRQSPPVRPVGRLKFRRPTGFFI